MTLAELRGDPGTAAGTTGTAAGTPGTSAAEDAWAAARASQPGWLTGPEAAAAACDATVVPVVAGHVDQAALDRLVDIFLAITTSPAAGFDPASLPARAGRRRTATPATGTHPVTPATTTAGGSQASPGRAPLSPATRDRLRRALLGLAADALSGPEGLAARLRAALDGTPLTTVSLPLDIGAATETIPAHLRRAVTTRHSHCAFPGCDQPASVCDVHHIVPRSRGRPTALPSLVPLCGFHHQVAVHRWGWYCN